MAKIKNKKYLNWLKKRLRVKRSLGVRGRYPRLVVYRSNQHIYAQVVDDNNSTTIASSSSKDKDVVKNSEKAGSKIEKSSVVGKALGEKLKKNKVEKVVFDRNGYNYHGRVKALADAVREAGIEL